VNRDSAAANSDDASATSPTKTYNLAPWQVSEAIKTRILTTDLLGYTSRSFSSAEALAEMTRSENANRCFAPSSLRGYTYSFCRRRKSVDDNCEASERVIE